MTIEALFKWAIKNDCEDMHIEVKALDERGETMEHLLDEERVEERNGIVVIDCR